MRSAKVIPFPLDLREEIKTEMNLAVIKYGPLNLEVLAIQKSWGDTMSDVEVLTALRKLNERGSIVDDITHS